MAAGRLVAVGAVKRLLFSPSWYRIADLRPRLRRQALLHRHVYRGAPWFVIDDRAAGQHHRFSAATHAVIGLFDGTRTVETVWRHALERLGDEAPTQDEVITLLAQLHGAGLLALDVAPETEDLFRRHRRERRQGWMKALVAPFSMKLPLFDPDPALRALAPLARALFSWPGLIVWLAVVGQAGWLAVANFDRLAGDLRDQILAPWSLAVMLVAYPALKLLHELGHGLAVVRWGGRVHDVGLMFVLLLPLPYVDASAASTFASKWQRIAVGAAGILVELFLAALALMAWLALDPGPLRSLAYGVMVIGSLSTLLFNGNPLMRFDGYYILSDAIEIPNLAQRSQRYLGYLARRWLFGLAHADTPVTARGEAGWFVVYGLASAVYRVGLAFFIAFFVAGSWPVIGGVLAAYALVLMILVPLGKTAWTLVADPDFARRRGRVAVTVAVIAALGLWAVAGLPIPRRTVVEGVSVPDEGGVVRTLAEGRVERLLVAPGTQVAPGDPLVLLTDDTVAAELRALDANLAALAARLREAEYRDPVAAQLIGEEMRAARAARAAVAERQARQVLTAGIAGRLIVDRPEDLPGRHLARGAEVALIAPDTGLAIAAAVPQSQMGALRQGVERVELWPLVRSGGVPVPARVLRLVPGGGTSLPAPALGTTGGGRLLMDPASPDRPRTLEGVFRVDLAALGPLPGPLVGQRVLVRFDHAPQTLAAMAWRSLRRVTLDRFGL